MKITYGMDVPLPPAPRVATVGMFDGVHRGHQRVLSEVTSWARSLGAEAAVITFDRHPLAQLGAAPPRAITSLEHRLLLCERLRVDVCLVLRFDADLAAMAPAEFVRRVLRDHLHVRGIVMGFDQRFGRGGQGDVTLMRRLGGQFGFVTRSVAPVLVRGKPISSTALREAVAAGELAYAEEMLGRPVSVLGTVVHGTERGRALGFPTANLDLHHELMPADGVYLTRTLYAGRWQPSLTHIGGRPAFADEDCAFAAEHAVETHLLDFDRTLYGETLEVQFVARLRDVKAFRGREELQVQLAEDVRRLREAVAAGRV